MKTILSENNFKAKVMHLQNDMFLYHRLNDDEFKDSNNLTYYLALLHEGKLYDLNTKSIYQFKNEYNFENAVNITKELLDKNNISGNKNDYIDSMIEAVKNNKWIVMWLFDFIKDYDDKNNTNYMNLVLKQREESLKAHDQRREEEKQRRMEEEKRQEAKRQEAAAIKDKENFCNGFLDNVNPMQRQRLAEVLNKKFRYDGIVRSRKENTLIYLKNGYRPDSKIPYGKAKEVYMLKKDNTYLEVSKTEYDYAKYLLNYGLDCAI